MEPRPVFFRVPEVILKLLVEPAFSAGAEGHRETDRHLRADTRTPVQNAGQRLPAHPSGRAASYGQVQGFQAQLPEQLTGVRRGGKFPPTGLWGRSAVAGHPASSRVASFARKPCQGRVEMSYSPKAVSRQSGNVLFSQSRVQAKWKCPILPKPPRGLYLAKVVKFQEELPHMTPGVSIAHYRITSKLGEGGMGEVWRPTIRSSTATCHQDPAASRCARTPTAWRGSSGRRRRWRR